jgi:hypothetical protein
MAKEDIQLKISAAVESAEAAKSLGQLRKSLMEIQSLQAEVGDESGAQFDKLTQAANAASAKLAETRDRIGDIQDKNRTLEGTPVERLTGSFGLLKESILNLDFDKAKIGAEGLLNTFTPVVDGKLVTGLAGVKGAFGMLGDGVKSLGSTFMSVGRALLTNPLFLLAAAIIAIVAVVILIMDKLGILKKIMDALGYAVGLVVQAFEALTDWLGLTTNAQEDNAAAAKKNGEEQRKQIDATATAQKNLLKLTEGMTDEEVALFKKKAGIKDALNKSSFDIEKDRLDQTQTTLKNEIDALNELEEAGGELTEEQLKDLEQRKADYTANAAAIKQLEYDKQKYIYDLNKKMSDTLQSWQVKNIKDENERAKAQLKITEGEEQRKIDAMIRDAKLNGQNYQILLDTKNEITKYYANEEIKINENIQKKNNDIAKAGSDKASQAIQKKLKELEDAAKLEVEKTKEGTQERINAQVKGEDIILAYKKANIVKLGISETQFALLKKQLENEQLERQSNFNKGVKELDDKAKLARDNTAILNAKTDEELYLAKRKLIQDTAQIEINNAAAAKDATEAIKKAAVAEQTRISAQAFSDIKALDNEYETSKADDTNTYAQIRLSRAQFNLEQYEAITRDSIKKIRRLEEQANLQVQQDLDAGLITAEEAEQRRLDIKKRYKDMSKEYLFALDTQEQLALEAAMDLELSNTELTEAQKAEIKERYRQLNIEQEQGAQERLRQMNFEQLATAAEYAEKGLKSVTEISDAAFAWKQRNLNKETKALMANLKTGTKEYDTANAEKFKMEQALARKMFNTNKALQLGGAVIDGFKAITSSLSMSPIAIGPIPNPAGIASLAFAAITTAASIAKIAASKFQEGTAPAATVTAPSVDGGGDGGGSAPTNFNPNQFFGLGQQTAAGMPGGPKPIKVYVSEGDIREVSERVSVIETRAVY